MDSLGSLPSLDSLPPVSESAIKKMKENAQKNYGIEDTPSVSYQTNQPYEQHDYSENNDEREEIQESIIEEKITESKKPDPSTSKERNMRALTAKAEQLERERDEALRLLKQREAGITHHSSTENSSIEDTSLSPDDLVTGRDVARIYEKQKKLEASIYQQQQNYKLRQQCPDFDKVVNAETLNTLRYAYPEIYKTLDSGTDIYTTGMSAYAIMKNMGIVDTPDNDHEKNIIKKNSEKPRPLTSISSPSNNDKSPLARSSAFGEGLDKATKERLWKEMNEYRRGY